MAGPPAASTHRSVAGADAEPVAAIGVMVPGLLDLIGEQPGLRRRIAGLLSRKGDAVPKRGARALAGRIRHGVRRAGRPLQARRDPTGP